MCAPVADKVAEYAANSTGRCEDLLQLGLSSTIVTIRSASFSVKSKKKELLPIDPSINHSLNCLNNPSIRPFISQSLRHI